MEWNGRLLGDAVLSRLLAPGGWFLLESFARGGAGAVEGSRWELRDERRYGDALIGYYHLKPDPAHAALDDTAGIKSANAFCSGAVSFYHMKLPPIFLFVEYVCS